MRLVETAWSLPSSQTSVAASSALTVSFQTRNSSSATFFSNRCAASRGAVETSRRLLELFEPKRAIPEA
jgi:hypothetical protein